MALVGNSFRVPTFVTASSPKDLVRVMLNNNINHGKEFTYFDIQKDGSKWFAWYYTEINVMEALTQPTRKGGK
jgi:hypothetical protein